MLKASYTSSLRPHTLETRQEMPPHNLLLFFMGGSLLWVGWFGFNAGSALAANQSASMALMVTHISGCAGGLSWMLLEWALKGM